MNIDTYDVMNHEYEDDPAHRLIRWVWLMVVVVMPLLALIPLPDAGSPPSPVVEYTTPPIDEAAPAVDTAQYYAAIRDDGMTTDFSVMSEAEFE